MPYAPITLVPFLTWMPPEPNALAAVPADAVGNRAGHGVRMEGLPGPGDFGLILGAAAIRGRDGPDMVVRAPMMPVNDSVEAPAVVATPTTANTTIGVANTSLPAFSLVLRLITVPLDYADEAGTSLLPGAAESARAPFALAPTEGNWDSGMPIPWPHPVGGSTQATLTDLFAAEATTDPPPAAPPVDETDVEPAVVLRVQVAADAEVGTPVDVVVVALSAANRPAAGYTGTVVLRTSDAGATLPPAAAFQPGNNGIQVMTLTFAHAGTQTITVIDGANALRETVTVSVRRPLVRRRDKRYRDVLDIWMAS